MDQIKIGKFIAERRRKEGLTQKQLAGLLHLTDKTVSKWETGCRLPDASLLPALRSILKADINELLAGEEFLSQAVSTEEYAEKAEWARTLGLPAFPFSTPLAGTAACFFLLPVCMVLGTYTAARAIGRVTVRQLVSE